MHALVSGCCAGVVAHCAWIRNGAAGSGANFPGAHTRGNSEPIRWGACEHAPCWCAGLAWPASAHAHRVSAYVLQHGLATQPPLGFRRIWGSGECWVWGPTSPERLQSAQSLRPGVFAPERRCASQPCFSRGVLGCSPTQQCFMLGRLPRASSQLKHWWEHPHAFHERVAHNRAAGLVYPSMPGLPTGRAGMSLHMFSWMLARLGLALGHSTILALLACCRSRFGLFIS